MKYLNQKPKNNTTFQHTYYEVEKIITRKTKKNKKLYLIKWKNFPLECSTWEPLSHLTNVLFLVQEFEKNYPDSICTKDLQKVMVIALTKGKKRKYKNTNKNLKLSKFLGDNKIVINLQNTEIHNFDKDEDFDKKTENTDVYIDVDEEKEINIKKLSDEKKSENMKLIKPIIIC